MHSYSNACINRAGLACLLGSGTEWKLRARVLKPFNTRVSPTGWLHLMMASCDGISISLNRVEMRIYCPLLPDAVDFSLSSEGFVQRST